MNWPLETNKNTLATAIMVFDSEVVSIFYGEFKHGCLFDHSDLMAGIVTEFVVYLCGGLSCYWKGPVYLALNES